MTVDDGRSDHHVSLLQNTAGYPYTMLRHHVHAHRHVSTSHRTVHTAHLGHIRPGDRIDHHRRTDHPYHFLRPHLVHTLVHSCHYANLASWTETEIAVAWRNVHPAETRTQTAFADQLCPVHRSAVSVIGCKSMTDVYPENGTESENMTDHMILTVILT
jgi:hypothetical protein